MAKLVALEVERTDAVDKPATGHRWMIVKSEGEKPVDLTAIGTAALEALAKDDGANVSKEAAELLGQLAEALGVEWTLKAEAAEDAEAGEAGGEAGDEADEAAGEAAGEAGEEEAEVAKDERPLAELTAGDLFALVNKAIDARLEAEADEKPVAKAERPKSRQATAQDESPDAQAVAKGERVSYADVVFEQ